ncbi:MAG: hypothetical protein AUK02_04150 [Anaerolineae bacterium CG2_30_58_95]|nr:MAG: hypothetical protein AUK02_04150 [Anaerolineae bacterium CG2_30_58_95]PJH75206.1 MAG: hypothetical protein CO064_07895 [Anaerolineae bacterium CG_4_9_14_0_8_um_filter_58_9]
MLIACIVNSGSKQHFDQDTVEVGQFVIAMDVSILVWQNRILLSVSPAYGFQHSFQSAVQIRVAGDYMFPSLLRQVDFTTMPVACMPDVHGLLSHNELLSL